MCKCKIEMTQMDRSMAAKAAGSSGAYCLLCYITRKGHSYITFAQSSDRPKQCFTVLPEPNRTSQSKFCFQNRNRTEPNRTEHVKKTHEKLDLNCRSNKQTNNFKFIRCEA